LLEICQFAAHILPDHSGWSQRFRQESFLAPDGNGFLFPLPE